MLGIIHFPGFVLFKNGNVSLYLKKKKKLGFWNTVELGSNPSCNCLTNSEISEHFPGPSEILVTSSLKLQ
jgi:hypothetical protein